MPPARSEPARGEPALVRSGAPRRRNRRFLLIAAAALAVIVALAAGALVSWHFSSAVLVPDRSPWPEDTTVEALMPGRIVLDPSDETLRPGVYGLLWQGGHAIVGEVLSRDEDSVTRRLSAVHGYLVPESKVAIDSYVYSGDPLEARGLRSSTESTATPRWACGSPLGSIASASPSC